MEVVEIDSREPCERELAALTRFTNVKRAESDPEDEPVTVEAMSRTLAHNAPQDKLRYWAIWDASGSGFVALARLKYHHGEDNQHAAELTVTVLPECRRQGLGSRLLPSVVEGAESAGRRLLISYTESEIPSGRAFMHALGARMGIEQQVSQLRLSELARDEIQRWLSRGQELSDEFELGSWDGPYPEEALAEVTRMYQAINLAPRGELEVEDEVWTPELLRERDAAMVARGGERCVLYARERSTGIIAGYTQTWWSPNQPSLVQQGDTAVFPEYRGKGIARWLKAAMIDRVVRERPYASRVRTDNADENRTMLQINWDMGFKKYKTWEIWQIEISRVRQYLATRGEML